VQAKLFIDTRYGDNIDLITIADEACFSKFHFIRLFSNIYRKTPHQYLMYVRIENAKVLLQKNVPVSETCFAVGFDSVSSFTALFKRYTTICPSEYQQRFKDRNMQIQKTPLQFIPNCFAENKGCM
jgi:AraC-like DNA-binding protein